jgi:hypothetical protein
MMSVPPRGVRVPPRKFSHTLPPELLADRLGSFVAVEIAADGTDYDSWRRPIRAY